VHLTWHAVQLVALVLLWLVGFGLLAVALAPDDVFDRWT
jgi:hypothetical protein